MQTVLGLFSYVTSAFTFVGDHRFGAFAVLAFAAGAYVRVQLPLTGKLISNLLFAVGIAILFLDLGYSYRAKIDREEQARADMARKAAEFAEDVRRRAVLSQAWDEADRRAQALKGLEKDRQRILEELDNATRNNRRPGLSLPLVLQLDRIR